MKSCKPDVAPSRTESETRAFREVHRLLVGFGVGAIPATLLLCVMGGDFLEGDFGFSGSLVMMLAGGMSPVCLATSVRARRLWASGAAIERVNAAICWPVLAPLVGICVGMFVFSARFASLVGI